MCGGVVFLRFRVWCSLVERGGKKLKSFDNIVMNKIFCVACGGKNLYELVKPKFCALCGVVVGGVIVDEVVGDEEVVSDLPDISTMRGGVSIEGNGVGVVSLSDVIGTSSGGGLGRRPSVKLPRGKALLEQSEMDCAPVKKPIDIDER